MFERKLPKEFWVEVINTSIYLLNRLQTKVVEEKTPFESYFGNKPFVSLLKVFGYVCFAHMPKVKQSKLERRSQPGIFLVYSNNKKGCRIYDPSSKKVFACSDVVFDEGRTWN